LRRAFSLAALGLVLLTAAFGWWLYRSHFSPEALQGELERRLSELLATPVALGPVSLGFDRDGIELASEGFRAFPSEGNYALTAGRVEIQVDLWSALLGEVHVRGLGLASPSLRLRRRAGGLVIDAPDGERLSLGTGRGEKPADAPPWYEALAGALPRIAVTAGRVVLVDGAGPGRDLAVESLAGALQRRWLRGGIGIDASGELRAGGDAAGAFELEGALAERSSLRIAVEELDLAAAAKLAGQPLAGLAPRGRATGTLRSEDGQLVAVDLRAGRLRIEPTVAGRHTPLDLTRVALAAGRRAAAGGGALLAGTARLGALSVPFEISLARGSVERVHLGSLELAALAPLAEALREPERGQLKTALQHLRGGRVDELELSWPAAGGFRVRARAAEAALAVGSGSRIEGLSGELLYDGDVLELRGVRSLLDGQPLPTLDARLAGLAEVRGFSELRCVEPAPASSLPGRRPLADWIAGERREGRPPSWKRLSVEADWLEHPALLCTVEGLAGEITPDPAGGGLRVALERATWAGVPIRGSASYRVRPEEAVSLQIDVGPPFEPSQPELHRSAWASGRFAFETSSLGAWKARDVTGSFRAAGTRLSLVGAKLRLDPGPVLDAAVDLDLGGTERVPVEVRAAIASGTFPELYGAGGWTEQATGALSGSAQLSGALEAGHSVLADATGSYALEARDGVLRQRFRLLLAVAMASETLNPFRDRGTIRYQKMEARGRFEGGAITVDSFSIDGPALRVAANGRIGATGAHDTELVVGMFFFRTLDSVIGRVPLLNRVLLGKEGNLLGAYVAVTGPWDGLGASIIPTRTLMKGPVSFVVEGLPAFVRGSLRAVQTMLPTEPPVRKEDS
jgi:hypothetical protein